MIILTLFLILTAFSYTNANIFQENNSTDETRDISGYSITNIDYTLLPGNPSKVSSISLDVVPGDSDCEAASARINVDSGVTWVTCTCPEADKWVCSFPSLKEPGIDSISDVRLVTKTSVPWPNKLIYLILQMFNQYSFNIK